MTLTVTVDETNSFLTPAELFSKFAYRLDADQYTYDMAVQEAADFTALISAEARQILCENYGATVVAIEALLTTAAITYDIDQLTHTVNLLLDGKTSVQARNNKAVILATRLIDQNAFMGCKTSDAQPLQWPRTGANVPTDAVPGGIKTATAELTKFLLQYDVTDPVIYRHVFGLTSHRAGESQSSFAKSANKRFPDDVTDLIRPYLLNKSDFSSDLIF